MQRKPIGIVALQAVIASALHIQREQIQPGGRFPLAKQSMLNRVGKVAIKTLTLLPSGANQ